MTELQDSREQRRLERKQHWRDRNCQGSFGIVHNKPHGMLTGIFLLLIGVVALMRIYVDGFPDWLFGWEMLLIAFGLFIGISHNFRGGAWIILILIGGIFLSNSIFPDLSVSNLWPVALIVLGLFIILRLGRRRKRGTEPEGSSDPFLTEQTSFSAEDYVSNTSIFGGAKKNVISKNFKGGDLVNIFGGTELDLSQADFTGVAVIELTTIFGGTKMVIPSNWSVNYSDAVTIFGGLEDKRKMLTGTSSPEKTLVIKGTVIFGGIEVNSF